MKTKTRIVNFIAENGIDITPFMIGPKDEYLLYQNRYEVNCTICVDVRFLEATGKMAELRRLFTDESPITYKTTRFYHAMRIVWKTSVDTEKLVGRKKAQDWQLYA